MSPERQPNMCSPAEPGSTAGLPATLPLTTSAATGSPLLASAPAITQCPMDKQDSEVTEYPPSDAGMTTAGCQVPPVSVMTNAPGASVQPGMRRDGVLAARRAVTGGLAGEPCDVVVMLAVLPVGRPGTSVAAPQTPLVSVTRTETVSCVAARAPVVEVPARAAVAVCSARDRVQREVPARLTAAGSGITRGLPQVPPLSVTTIPVATGGTSVRVRLPRPTAVQPPFGTQEIASIVLPEIS